LLIDYPIWEGEISITPVSAIATPQDNQPFIYDSSSEVSVDTAHRDDAYHQVAQRCCLSTPDTVPAW
jgi:hypothetical protein